MTLKAKIESLDEVPEALREHYSPADGDDGGFKLSVEKSGGLALVSEEGALKAARDARREADEAKRLEREARQRLEAFGDLEPGKARDALAELDKLRKNPPKGGEVDMDAVKRELMEREVKPLLDRARETEEKLKAQAERLSSSYVSAEIKRVLSDPELDGRFGLLGDHMARRIKAQVTDEGVALQVLDRDGQPWSRFDDKGTVTAATVRDLAEELANDREFAPAFGARSKSPHGVNGSGAAGGRKTDNPFKSKTPNVTEISRLARENPAEYARLKAEAGA
ncbi:hypothetical protein [Engelhardtia mirabilis]|uniref:Uncharacterized protein n=1 Tax=Engelhardtia mirabilis TaxID=2528011 RepID=A0A518BL49_9BACT|nr:hypothetical protein Pla133_27890 [Planctomycetes bacterium Pla133]QDV02027.1 hypothetical protein Pla86_27880 [Planctomycetes bacterium Pla86]